MKKIFLLSLFALLFPSLLYSEPVDVETARQQATKFLMQRQSSKGRRLALTNKPLRLLHTQRQTADEVPTLYVFGNEGIEGFVVIAGDDAAISPVLGYSNTGIFNLDSIPCNLRYLLGEYGRQLAYARKHPSSMKASPSITSREAILPLTTSKWGQGAPYNSLCPIDPNTGYRSDAGCVATALAQIMYYHKWPEQGMGSHSYEWEGQTLSADFSATTYQWDKMKDTYTLEDVDPNNAVATLMYHCGVAVDSRYSSYGTGANICTTTFEATSTFVDVLKNYFNYAENVTTSSIDGSWYADHDEILYNELRAQRPVLIAGGGSHVFICDGYENGYYHFNFGWSGYCDDYFLLTAINPEDRDYSWGIEITYGIRKYVDRQTVDGIFYELYEDGTARIVRGSAEGDYTIPSSIEVNGKNYEITAIGYEAFKDCNGLTSVTIPSSITFIGCSAFRFCTGIKSVSIPNSVTKIGNYAFDGCTSLTSVTLPNSITIIGFYAFQGCSNLASVTIPNSVVEIGWGAFEGCSSLITPIYTPTTFICMPTSYEGEYVIPDGITEIAPSAFYQCTKLTSVTIPPSVTSIGDMAFQGCSNASINIPANVTEIGQFAFGGCVSLTSITIPKHVTSIGFEAFGYCNNLTSIVVEEGNDKYDSRNNCNAIIETETNTLLFGCNTTVIPNGITDIGYGAFTCFSGFTTIDIPNSVKTIDRYAFAGCGGLTSMVIPEGVTDIYDSAFLGCTNLTSINFPSSIEFLGGSLLSGCTSLESFENVTLPANLTYIPWSMFSGCSSLTSVSIPDHVTDILDGAFSGCTNLSLINFPNSVKQIGKGAFSGCNSLTSIILPSSVEMIDPLAFSGCIGLNSIQVEKDNQVYDSRETCNAIIETASNTLMIGCKNTTIPYGVESIGPSSFAGCSSLTSLNIPNSVTSIGDYAFQDCSALTSLNIPNSVTSIGDYAFQDCSALTSMTFPESVTQINDYTLYGCSSLETVIFPQNVTSIGRYVFYECNSLKDVYCYAVTMPEAVSYEAFMDTDLSKVTLHVPASAIDAYRDSWPWCWFGKIIPIVMMGDVNEDGYIDVADLTAVVKFILGDAESNLQFYAADIDESGVVEINDYSAVVNMVMAQENDPQHMGARHLSAYNDLSLCVFTPTTAFVKQNGEGEVMIQLMEDGNTYTGMQFELSLPEGLDIANDGVSAISKKHDVIFTRKSNGDYRILCTSANNAELSGDNIVCIRLKDVGAMTGTYEIAMNNIVLSDMSATRHTTMPQVSYVMVGDDATGLAEIKNNLEVSVGQGALTLKAHSKQPVTIVTLSGIVIDNFVMNAGETRTLRLDSGMYFVNKKMIINK